MFGINQVPIHDDVKDSAAALDQLRLDTRCLLDRVRQTGGLRGVVSLHAVGDAYLHSEFLCWPDVRKRGYLQTATNQFFKRREACSLSSQCRANAEFCRDNVEAAPVRFDSYSRSDLCMQCRIPLMLNIPPVRRTCSSSLTRLCLTGKHYPVRTRSLIRTPWPTARVLPFSRRHLFRTGVTSLSP